MKNYQRGFVGMAIAILVALVLGTGGAYFYDKGVREKENVLRLEDAALQQEASNSTKIENVKTSDWKIYKNDKYGFEFQYPSAWGEMFKNKNLTELNCVPSSNNHTAGLEYSIPVLFVGLACENYRSETNDLINTVPKKINIGGRESYFYEYTSATNYTNKEIFIPLYDGIYIYLAHSYKNSPQYTQLSADELNKIISTFKFTQAGSNISNQVVCVPNSYVVSDPQYKDKYSLFDSHIDPQSLIFCDKNGKNIILINGLLKLPIFADVYNNNKIALFKLAQPKNEDTVFIYTSIPETDAGIGKVYRFNPKDLSFTSLKIVVEGYRVGVGTLSPEQDKYTHTRDSEIYICNLLSDNCEKALTLLPGEYLNRVQDLSSLGETIIKWKDNSTLEYNVYFSEIGTDGYRKLKEIRNLKI